MPVIVFRVATDPPASTSTSTRLFECAGMGSSELSVNRVSTTSKSSVAPGVKSTHF